jgi:hypothetical protein
MIADRRELEDLGTTYRQVPELLRRQIAAGGKLFACLGQFDGTLAGAVQARYGIDCDTAPDAPGLSPMQRRIAALIRQAYTPDPDDVLAEMNRINEQRAELWPQMRALAVELYPGAEGLDG